MKYTELNLFALVKMHNLTSTCIECDADSQEAIFDLAGE
ncbi:hypothetical protein NVP1076O_15 [Vibrio phage 1.076.O._10N.286.51.B7]|nr:hypothetical protein NVP1076O_15 [Vibrio phage 1.076.O._10N.286.51.B7]